MGRQGVRSGWSEVPASVRDALDALLGSPVVATTGVSGGFSPGPAVRADLADGRRVFVKAAGTALNTLSPGMHRREAAVLRALPSAVPAPRLLGVVDDGDWVALAIEWVAGRMPSATDAADVTRLLALVERLAAAGEGVHPPGVGAVAEVHPALTGQWLKLVDRPVAGLDEWSIRNLDRLAELDAVAPPALEGTCLLHVDLRTDNVLLGADPTIDVVVDWPAASIGAPWIDLLGVLPALHLDGGPAPADVFDAHPVGRAADAEAVDAVVVALAGYFTRQSLLPPPPGLPTVRAFQAAQGAITRRWAAERLRLT